MLFPPPHPVWMKMMMLILPMPCGIQASLGLPDHITALVDLWEVGGRMSVGQNQLLPESL